MDLFVRVAVVFTAMLDCLLGEKEYDMVVELIEVVVLDIDTMGSLLLTPTGASPGACLSMSPDGRLPSLCLMMFTFSSMML